MNNELIQRISGLALKNYREKITPDPFAAAAAHAVCTASAAIYSPESADAAAFVAVASIVDFSMYSAQQAASATGMHHAMKNYAKDSHTRSGLTTAAPAFEVLVQKLEKVSFGREANDIYTATFNASELEKYQLARHAATVIYNHAYACSRAAYTHATAIAARYPEGENRYAVFKTAITKRLSADLRHEPIDPGLFMQIMCSDAMKMFGVLLLVAGVAALLLGSCGLGLAPVAAGIAACTSISSASILTGGIVTTAASGALFAGRFFTAKQWKNDNDKSAEAVIAMNDLEQGALPAIA